MVPLKSAIVTHLCPKCAPKCAPNHLPDGIEKSVFKLKS